MASIELVLMVLVGFIFTALLASRTTHPMNESGTFFTKMKIQCIDEQCTKSLHTGFETSWYF